MTAGPRRCSRRFEPLRATRWCCPAPSATRSTPSIPPCRWCGVWATAREPPSCTAAPAESEPPPASRGPNRTSATGWRATRESTTCHCASTAPPCRTTDATTAGWRFRGENTSASRTRWEPDWGWRVRLHKQKQLKLRSHWGATSMWSSKGAKCGKQH